MNAFTKVKLARNSLDEFSPKIVQFISEHSEFFDIVDDIKLCANCDYLHFDSKLKRLVFYSSELGNLFFDFSAEMNYHRHQKYAITKEPLAKALGLIGNVKRLVWDTTCGTGKDALLISHFGADVVAFERNPIIFVLLLDAKNHYEVPIEFLFGDSSLVKLDGLNIPDVIYYDPMYPEKKKSALPRKEMQIFKSLIGPDTDSHLFLDWARKHALERVVVKRSLKAPAVHDDITNSYEGKSTRYDMYKIFQK